MQVLQITRRVYFMIFFFFNFRRFFFLLQMFFFEFTCQAHTQIKEKKIFIRKKELFFVSTLSRSYTDGIFFLTGSER